MFVVSYLFITSSYFLITFLYISFGIWKGREIRDIWLRLNKFCAVMDNVGIKVDFVYIKKCSNIVVISLYFFCSIYMVFDYLDVLFRDCKLIDLLSSVYFQIISFLVLSFECQIFILLLIVQICGQSLNNNLKKNSNLSEIMKFHFEFFDICQCINKLYRVYIFRIFLGFYGLSITVLTLIIDETAFYEKANKNFAYIIAFLLWAIVGVSGIIVITFFCDITKHEVSFSY